MPRNGAGTYTLPSGNPVVTGTVISSTVQNNTMTDIATALTQSIASNGQTPITANIPMAGYKLTGLAAATIDGDAIRYQQVFPSLSTTTVVAGSGGLFVNTAATLGAVNVAPKTTDGAGVYVKSPSSFTGSALSSNSDTAAGTGWNHMYCASSNNTVANAILLGNGNWQNANNSYGAISDARLKEGIQDAKAVRDRALLVRLVSYRLKSDPTQKQLGVIAQEIQSIFPGLIEESQMRDKDGKPTGETYLTVKYSVLSLILFKAWQESESLRDSQIASIQARLDAAGL